MSAKNLAAKVQPGSTVRWDRLEAAAFAAHAWVLQQGGVSKGAARRFGKSNWNFIWAVPLIILYLFCYTAPIWGTAAISVSRFQSYQQDPEQRIPLSGLMFCCALLLLVVSFVHWVIKGRKPSGFYEAQAALALILGGLSAAAVRMYGERDSVESWHTWIILVLAATIAGAIFLVFLVTARARNAVRQRAVASEADASLPSNKLELLRQRRERVQQLSAAERGSIEEDLDAAISDLMSRHLISEADAQRARSTELGGLALRMGRK